MVFKRGSVGHLPGNEASVVAVPSSRDRALRPTRSSSDRHCSTQFNFPAFSINFHTHPSASPFSFNIWPFVAFCSLQRHGACPQSPRDRASHRPNFPGL